MNYDITKPIAPAMPSLGKGTECIKILLSQVSKDVQEPIVPMLFPILGAHMSGAEFQYPDLSWKEPCGMMANLVAESGGNKGQLSLLVEAICRDFRLHDEVELRKLVEWQKQVKTKGANKEKPARPEVAFWIPPSDVTNPAFLQNAMALEKFGGRTQYINMPEVDMADRMCGGHKQVSQMLRNIYDRQRAGALRATADGVTGNPILRCNLTISSTPFATRKFYKYELFNGTFGRMVFSYKPRDNRSGKIPRIGKFSEEFYQQLDEYLARLDNCKGRYIIKPLNKLIERLSNEVAELGDLTDNDSLWDMGKRSLISAWKAGCVMWALNNMAWSRSMADAVEFLVWHDLWSKYHVLGDMLKEGDTSTDDASKALPANMLDDIKGDSFTEQQLDALRQNMGKPTGSATKRQLRVWVHRELVTFNSETGLYTKTETYLKRNGQHQELKN